MAKADYVLKNREWLQSKAQEPGVKTVGRGIYYKVLSAGKSDGLHPNPNSVVVCHYTGRLINGKKFDSSRGGASLACRLRDLVQGWVIALQQMRPGDKWELYLPAEMGYGTRSIPGIPGGSTLIFEIELLSIA